MTQPLGEVGLLLTLELSELAPLHSSLGTETLSHVTKEV